jgi:hypothetical protein
MRRLYRGEIGDAIKRLGQLVEYVADDVDLVRDFSHCLEEVIRCLEGKVLPRIKFGDSVIEEMGGNPRRFARHFMEFWWSAVVVLFCLMGLRRSISSERALGEFRRLWRRWKLFMDDVGERFRWSVGLYWGKERIRARTLGEFIDRYPFKHLWKDEWGRGSGCVICAYEFVPKERVFPLLDFTTYMEMLNSLRNGGGFES